MRVKSTTRPPRVGTGFPSVLVPAPQGVTGMFWGIAPLENCRNFFSVFGGTYCCWQFTPVRGDVATVQFPVGLTGGDTIR